MINTEACRPGRLKVLLGAKKVMVRCAISGSSDAIGRWLLAAIDQIAMNFVGADQHVARQAQLGHAFQFVAAKHAPHRIVRIAEDEGARVGVKRRFQIDPNRRHTYHRAGRRARLHGASDPLSCGASRIGG